MDPDQQAETRIAPGWESVIKGRRELSDAQRRVALALAVNVRGGTTAPTISRLALDSGQSDRTVRRTLAMLHDTGWIDRDAGGFRLSLGPFAQPTPEPDAWRMCELCDGTGFVEIPPPPGASGPEQPWVVKCQECKGRGRRPIDGYAAIQAAAGAPTDAQLVELWRREGLERRQDGELYRIGDDRPIRLAVPESAKPPLPDGTRPEGGTDDDGAR